MAEVRLQVKTWLNPEFIDILEYIQGQSPHISNSDLIRTSLKYYSWILKRQEIGEDIYVKKGSEFVIASEG